jgi:hypothetical protein
MTSRTPLCGTHLLTGQVSLVESHLGVRGVSKLDCRVWLKLRTSKSNPVEKSLLIRKTWWETLKRTHPTTLQHRRAFEQPTYLSITDRYSLDFAHQYSPALPVQSHVNSSVLRLLSGVAASEEVSYFGVNMRSILVNRYAGKRFTKLHRVWAREGFAAGAAFPFEMRA